MKLRGGYNVLLQGRPSRDVKVLPECDTLYVPLTSRRFTFSEVAVENGDRVNAGQTLAKDPENYGVPLLAPREGTVSLSQAAGHIVLTDVVKTREEPYDPSEDMPHIPTDMGSVGMQRYKLLMLGAWQWLQDAHTGALPDPFGTPLAVIVSTVHLEPFLARGDVQIRSRLETFTRGLEHIQAMLEYQPIFLVIPDIETAFADQVRDILRGYAWVKMVQIPLRYGLDSFGVIARRMGLKRESEQPVWALDAAGVLAIDRALTLSRPSTVRIVSIGGPGAMAPSHLKLMPGYPMRAILEGRISSGQVRVLDGGALTGRVIPRDALGLDAECTGLTLLPEHTEREFLGFMRPGLDRRSYSRCFASVLRSPFAGPLNTAVGGEARPCVSCGFCEEVCPARIMPHLIHKYLYHDALEDVEKARVDLCVKCGLCSYVCPSKIELTEQLAGAEETVQRELHAEEVAE